MTDRELSAALNQIRKAAGRAEGGVGDGLLLGRFAADGDEAAFELLVRRHQALVLGVCRRVLHHAHEAEDAFQATFLLLARKAAGIRQREALAGWLYRVAYRVALTARAGRARRAAREQPLAAAAEVPAPPDPAAVPEAREVWAAVDEEVNRLPERMRAAAALCYLEGKTVEEAAQQLGCPRGTVASRLARARQRLRVRLGRRGLAVPAACPAVQASEALVRAATRCAAAGAEIPAQIAELTQEVMRAMFIKRFTTAAVLVAAAGALLVGAVLAVPIPTGGGDREEKAAGGPKAVTVAHPTWFYPEPFADYTGRLEAHETVEVGAQVDGRLAKSHFKPGAEVQKGDLLFEIDPAPYQAVVEQAEANLDRAETARNRAEAEVEKLKADRVSGRPIPKKAIGDYAVKLETWEAQVRVAQALLAKARDKLHATRITAPLAGRVGEPLVAVGGRVIVLDDAPTALVTITPPGPIGVVFEMDERSLLGYRRLLGENKLTETGGPLYVGLADEAGFSREGKLDRFGVRVNPKTGTIGVYGTLPNPGGVMLPGMYARVRLPFTTRRRALAVPDAAVLTDGGKQFVWVVGQGNVAERRAVKVGAKEGGLRLIEPGFAFRPDTRVITGTGGAEGLRAGERVAPRPPDPRK